MKNQSTELLWFSGKFDQVNLRIISGFVCSRFVSSITLNHESIIPSVDATVWTMDGGDAKAEPEATQPASATGTTDMTSVDNHTDSPNKVPSVAGGCEPGSCTDSANDAVHDISSDASSELAQTTSDDQMVNKDVTPVVSSDSPGPVPVEIADKSMGHTESEATVDDIHVEDDSAIHMSMEDSVTEDSVGDDVMVSPDSSTADLQSDNISKVGSDDSACERGINLTVSDPRINPASECCNVDQEESSDIRRQNGGDTKKSKRNRGKKQRKKSGRGFSQPEKSCTGEEDDVEITFEVQSTGEGIDLVEVSKSHNVSKGTSYRSYDHHGKGAWGTVNDMDEISTGVQWMNTNPHQGMRGSAQYYGHGYGHDSTRYGGYNKWENWQIYNSGMGRGYRWNNTEYGGGYERWESPRGGHSRVGRGRALGTHNRESWGRGTFNQPGMHDKEFPPQLTEDHKPRCHGRDFANSTSDAANRDAAKNVAYLKERNVSRDPLYPIKSYHNKLEVSFPKKEPNDKNKIGYDVWHQRLGVDHMEKVKAKYPYQSVTLENLEVATWYEVLVTKRVNGEQMSITKQHVSTTPFGPPDNFSVERDSDGIVHFEWREPSVIAPEYRIEEYIITVSNYLECDVPQGKQSKFDGSIHTASLQLDAETSYIFEIEALCEDHVSEPSKAEILMPKHKMLKMGNKMETMGKPIFLLPMTDTTVGHGKLCRKELGKPSVPGIIRNEKVVLVVGATGSGKTTWINAILNNILGVKYTDNFRFKLVIDEDASNQAVSQTQHITIYTIHHQDGFKVDYTLTIIDTPGFGDTRGIQKDKEIEMELRKIFDPQNGCVDHLHAVGFVASASSARLTPTQKYIFTSILSLFGIDVGENIYMLFTFADGKPPQMMSAIKAANVPYQECFKFNNSAIFDDIGLEDDADFEMDDESEYFNKMFWELGMKSFDRFLSKVSLAQAKSLTLTRDVLNERGRMELNVENLNLQVRRGLSKMDQLRIEEKLLKQFEDAVESNKDYTYEIKRLEVKKIPIADNRNTTTCLTCNFTCHKNCFIPNDGDKAGCWAMDQRKSPVSCTQCPNHCVWNIHRNICYILEQTVITETSTLADLKARYEEASGKKLTAEQVYDKVKEELEAIETQIKANMSEISRSLNRLQEIALKNNPMSQIEYLDILIESENNEATPGWQERLKGLRDLRQQAQNIYDISQGEYDPFKTYREQAEKARREGCDMRHVSTWVTISNRVKNAVGKVGSFFGLGKDSKKKNGKRLAIKVN